MIIQMEILKFDGGKNYKIKKGNKYIVKKMTLKNYTEINGKS